jgi:RNA polymerase sigma factor (sigma-70 family)
MHPPTPFARAALVTSNLPLAKWVASRRFVHRTRIPLEDLVQEGAVALCLAADAYDASRSRFSTFAVRCIHRHLQKRVHAWGPPAASLPDQELAAAPDTFADEDVEGLLSLLTAPERWLVEAAFGLGNRPRATLVQIARELHITPQAVSARLRSVLRRLRESAGRQECG